MTKEYSVIASSFADPEDIAAFKRCKAKGGSDRHCFSYGDNGIGYWGDDTTEGSGPACALPPEDLVTNWGTVAKAHLKQVQVTHGNKSCVCLVKDTMPFKKYIKNGAGIDLNADACKALGLNPPVLSPVTWKPVN